MKLLSFNTNYFLGYTGAFSDYLKFPHRGVIGSFTEGQRMDELVDLIETERPDIVCLQEIDEGSIRSRTDGQIGAIGQKSGERGLEYLYSSDNKYGNNSIRHLPIFRKMANGVLWHTGQLRTHYFSGGVKQMVHELEMENGSVFSVHLPLTKKARRNQIKELIKMAEDRDNFIITGDFNVRNEAEFRPLKENGINDLSFGPTYPVKQPKYALDRVFYSEGVNIKRTRAVEGVASDHKPIICEFEF